MCRGCLDGAPALARLIHVSPLRVDVTPKGAQLVGLLAYSLGVGVEQAPISWVYWSVTQPGASEGIVSSIRSFRPVKRLAVCELATIAIFWLVKARS